MSGPVQEKKAGGVRGLKRSLSARQMQMLAVGGVIGVGLFYGASVSVSVAGPSVLIDFIVCGLLVAIVMRALAEMVVERPVSGSFGQYAAHWLGSRIGFVTAGMWWFFWVATVMSELAAIGKLLQFWWPQLPVWLPGAVALVLFTITNLLAVRVFGEIEYWFAVLKVLTVLVFIVFGALIAAGALVPGYAPGLRNLYAAGGFMPGGWLGLAMAISLVVQAYSGVETLAVESGESADPERNVRRAFRTVTWRIAILYIGSMLILLCAYPWTQLIHQSGSPYVQVFRAAGVPFAAGLVNLVIVLSGLSSCNTGLYGGSRMLYGMAEEAQRAGWLRRVNRRHVPHLAVWTTAIAIAVGVVLTYLAPNQVYVWITSASAFADLWVWGVILACEISVRRQARRTGQSLRYPVPLWPAWPIAGLVLVVLCFAAIVASPLTRVSVFSGVLFLVLLWLYDVVAARRRA